MKLPTYAVLPWPGMWRSMNSVESLRYQSQVPLLDFFYRRASIHVSNFQNHSQRSYMRLLFYCTSFYFDLLSPDECYISSTS
ncbi:hypothetical protein HETIRDRAFT_420963 [Heterobasidion irregulare TC 32-1]|uniref:Uncharacterized protein n=1 Tax=Heterobasidion irregulare (strain TC 32-1) TaxID=747525 RepID=W4JXA3_HETIT|nr:uncharacterized protein HETIRDRAFT_420963 [Heterobasidion irregulare TC 32-1]ETW78178.1 hypothetical protein HETIRDRAFT_420963 [Heterobasidion irregulare TC 32-1]